jgi:NIMA (never in mitosis gene a)-related kinase
MERRDALDDYEVVKKVGSGSFGAAHLVRSKRNRQYYVMKTVKMAQMKPKDRDALQLEVKLLSSLDHQFIVSYNESFIDPGRSMLCLVMQYCEGGDLSVYLKNLRGRRLSERVMHHCSVYMHPRLC